MNVVAVRFEKGTHRMFWKESYQQNSFSQYGVSTEKYQESNVEFLQRSLPRGVCTAKRDEIISKLCQHMQPTRREFWKYLAVNPNSPDLVKERDVGEESEDS